MTVSVKAKIACQFCGVDVTGASGVGITVQSMRAYKRAVIDEVGQDNYPNVEDWPGEIDWRIFGQECAGESDAAGYDYWIEWNRINTPAKAWGWHTHLSGKNWFPYTNWTGLMRTLGYVEHA